MTAPLWGAGDLTSQEDAQTYELKKLLNYQAIQAGLAKNGLKQERRPLLLIPEELSSTWLNDTSVKIDFYLPSGCYATSVLRELIRE
ncbi:tRNA pseudouridine(13) synthase TruD [Psychromonas sp. MME2]|uniref:tRNA pseudouridine(13) synthase TruD n=1 Tax=Psychromonas sp. MME2 TaxID=3231033 RepID=UPI00339C590A